jgi:hypothetical protein
MTLDRKTAFELLDKVLNELQGERGILNKRQLIEKLDKKGVKLSDKILMEILHKLEKDEYIRIDQQQDMELEDYPMVDYYLSTLEGRVFIGYGKENALKEDESEKLDKLESAQTENRTNMENLTIVIAFGTAVAAIYYSLQIWEYFHSCHCH